jgi:Fic family protein
VGWHFDDDHPPDKRTLLEAEGGRAQARLVRALVRIALRVPGFRLAPGTIRVLHRQAMAQLLPTAGEFRARSDLEIRGSRHVPPPHEDVPRLLADACDVVNARAVDEDPLFAAAYILWRICWIHPFDDGNGRTARAVAYLVLSQRLDMELPGKHPIPERIKYAPLAYVRALEAADEAWAGGEIA